MNRLLKKSNRKYLEIKHNFPKSMDCSKNSSKSQVFSDTNLPQGKRKISNKQLNLPFKEFMLLNCGFGEDSWESLRLQGDQTSQPYRKSVLNINRKD